MTQRTKHNIVYAPLNGLLHAIAYLPFWMLYGISDICFILVFYIFRYRRHVAQRNIDESFPEKSEKERYRILRKFYRHFTDTFVETIKLRHVSDDEMRRRMIFKNIEAVDESVAAGRSVVMYAAHYCNWEWLTTITMWSQKGPDYIQYGQIYRPLKNKWFNDFFLQLRGRFNSSSYPKNSAFRELLRAKHNGKITVTGFISDQHPNRNDEDDVIRFLNHDTAMITGSEVIAKKLDMDAMYFDVRKVARGHYVCTIHVISRCPQSTKQYEITNTYAQALERAIRENPSEWLWTHNRWKNKVKTIKQPNHE